YVLLLKNITELKRSVKIKNEFDKKTLEEGLRNEFLSTISHDLKTPINVIYTACQLQNSFLKNNSIEKINLYNHVNKENCMSLTRLANNLIDSSKLSYNYLKPQCELYNIVELVEECSNSLAEYIRDKNLEFEFDTEEEEIEVRCDKEFIERIIINLMSNAIKHTKQGIVKVAIFVNKFKVRIEVIDTGEGMDKEFLKKAFEKYSIEKIDKGYRNKSTGIGLYVVKNLVELQGGEIFIESQKGKGTIVKIEFFREKVNV
ncbi:sensor histidine kinase, partial [Clostridium tarantellae]